MFYFNNFLLFEEGLSDYSVYYDLLEDIRAAITDVIDFVIPTATTTLLVPLVMSERIGKIIHIVLLPSLSKLFYTIPYYYMYYIVEGYDSIESICLSLPATAVICLLTAAYTLLLAYISKLVYTKRGASFDDYPNRCPAFATSHPTTGSIFIGVAIHFATVLVIELISAVVFFIEYADNYRLGELFYILGSFVYILICMLLAQWICTLIHNTVIADRFERDEQ